MQGAPLALGTFSSLPSGWWLEEITLPPKPALPKTHAPIPSQSSPPIQGDGVGEREGNGEGGHLHWGPSVSSERWWLTPTTSSASWAGRAACNYENLDFGGAARRYKGDELLGGFIISFKVFAEHFLVACNVDWTATVSPPLGHNWMVIWPSNEDSWYHHW